jgi:hypothetical protein
MESTDKLREFLHFFFSLRNFPNFYIMIRKNFLVCFFLFTYHNLPRVRYEIETMKILLPVLPFYTYNISLLTFSLSSHHIKSNEFPLHESHFLYNIIIIVLYSYYMKSQKFFTSKKTKIVCVKKSLKQCHLITSNSNRILYCVVIIHMLMMMMIM